MGVFVVAAAAALAAQAAGFEPGYAVASAIAGLAWAAMLLDEVRGARRASTAFGTSARGFTRGQVTANLELVPTVVGLPVGLAIWATGQVRVRRLLGVTWDPLIPSLGEVFSRP